MFAYSFRESKEKETFLRCFSWGLGYLLLINPDASIGVVDLDKFVKTFFVENYTTSNIRAHEPDYGNIKGDGCTPNRNSQRMVDDVSSIQSRDRGETKEVYFNNKSPKFEWPWRFKIWVR